MTTINKIAEEHFNEGLELATAPRHDPKDDLEARNSMLTVLCGAQSIVILFLMFVIYFVRSVK